MRGVVDGNPRGDSTIVAVANPTIMAKLHTGYDTVVWMTSAYLLGYAVLLLVAGDSAIGSARNISTWSVLWCLPSRRCGVGCRAVPAC